MHSLLGKRAVMVVLTVAAVLLLPLAASATPLYLSVPNWDPVVYPLPSEGAYATVEVTFNPAVGSVLGSATFEFQSYGPYLFTDGGAIALNLGGTYTVSSAAAIGSPLVWEGPRQVDGWGEFNFVYTTGSSDYGHRFSSATIELTDVTATKLADLLLFSTQGGGAHPSSTIFMAAAHMGVLSDADDLTSDFSKTGFVANGIKGSTVVPLPAAFWLIGAGLVRLGLYSRRRRQS
jgi:hypothetical protein